MILGAGGLDLGKANSVVKTVRILLADDHKVVRTARMTYARCLEAGTDEG